MIEYGSDYLLGLATFAPDKFAERDPTQETNPTRLSRDARLWAKIAEELPNVIDISLASSSRSRRS